MDWQIVVTGLVLVGATYFVVRRVIDRLRAFSRAGVVAKSSCGGCSGCPGLKSKS